MSNSGADGGLGHAMDDDVNPPTRTTMPAHALPLGTRIRDYQILGLLGEGGFGIVYLAMDVLLERQVAIKEYLPTSIAWRGTGTLEVAVRVARDQKTFALGLRSFVNEARLLARFDHPSLIKVHRFWEENGTAYMVMPFYRGRTLQRTLERLGRRPSEAELRAWVAPLMDALQVMHAEKCYHRDISPDNVLITESGPMLLDFGAARRVIGDVQRALTVVLKPGFAPIEQYGDTPGLQQGAWTDVYALAGMLFAAITSRRPPPAVSRLMDDPMPKVSEVAAGHYSAAFLQAIDRGLALKPQDRPQSVAEFRALMDDPHYVAPPIEPAVTAPVDLDLSLDFPPTPPTPMTPIKVAGPVSYTHLDGVIHSWLNRLLLPDTVGTGGDSHTRFPIGISFPAGSGLVAFGAATGVMPLDMPESVLVRFKGQMQPGVTLRDLVHAIPLYAIKAGLLTVAKAGKKNVFSGRILEIEGLPDLKVEQAFELSDASAERSAAGCTIKLNPAPIKEYLTSNIVLMKNMIADGYQDARTLERRIEKVQAWLANPSLLEADKDAEYAAVIEIDLAEIKEPILCCPNDPDDAKFLSDVAGTQIDEAFIGSCMTNIGHFRAAAKLLGGQRDIPVKLWVAPPTKMDQSELIKEGHYAAFGTAGARTEQPGCSLCMGNQAQVREGATVVSTSTRNFPNRLGKNTNVYLASAELAAIASKLGHIPTVAEYHAAMGIINQDTASVYKYLNFDQIEEYAETARTV